MTHCKPHITIAARLGESQPADPRICKAQMNIQPRIGGYGYVAGALLDSSGGYILDSHGHVIIGT